MPTKPASSLRIVVLGYLVRGPLGGHAWHHLQYVAGLQRMGHDVWFVEDSDDYPSCYDPIRDEMSVDPTYGLAFAQSALTKIGLPDRWGYYDAHTRRWLGAGADLVQGACETAEVILNLSGNPLRAWTERIDTRVFIDTDPGFTQATHLSDAGLRARAAQHTAFFTFAENIATTATLPDDGFPWWPTRQPVVMDLWAAHPAPADGAFTTVMLWDSYPEVTVGGVTLGLKSRSFTPYLDLPRDAGVPLELAVGGPSVPTDLLVGHGWRVIDPRGPTRSLETYQAYLSSSLGEFGVAKDGYVTTNSGWFSERSANYLASGRPVITQDTGFSDVLPTGNGLMAFSTPDEALDGLASVRANHAHHCRSARDVAQSYFDSNLVLSALLNRTFQS